MRVHLCVIMFCSEAWAEEGFPYDIGDYKGGTVVRAKVPTEDGSQIYDVVRPANLLCVTFLWI